MVKPESDYRESGVTDVFDFFVARFATDEVKESIKDKRVVVVFADRVESADQQSLFTLVSSKDGERKTARMLILIDNELIRSRAAGRFAHNGFEELNRRLFALRMDGISLETMDEEKVSQLLESAAVLEEGTCD